MFQNYCVAMIAAAIEARQEVALSALLVITRGTLPPIIMPAAHAPKN